MDIDLNNYETLFEDEASASHGSTDTDGAIDDDDDFETASDLAFIDDSNLDLENSPSLHRALDNDCS